MTVIDHSTDQTGEFAAKRVNGAAKAGMIYSLIPKVMGEVGAIGKGKRNVQQGYMFRGIDDVYQALQGPLVTHGLFYVPRVISETREERTSKGGGLLIYTTLRVRFTLYAPDGSSVSAVMSGEAMDSGDKSTNKAMSAALKYFLLQTFCIPTEEAKDSEHDSPEPAPRQQQRAAPPQRQTNRPPHARTETAPAAGDELSDVDTFRGALADAMRLRAWPDAYQTSSVGKVCQKKGVKSLAELALADRHAFLAAVSAGEMDPPPPKAQKQTAAA